MRKYEPIWTALKKDLTVRISAPVSSHNRIIKAVRKEKARDRGWKLIQGEERKRYKLMDFTEGEVITFTLIEDKSTYIADLIL